MSAFVWIIYICIWIPPCSPYQRYVGLDDRSVWLIAVSAFAERYLLAPPSLYDFIDGLAWKSEARSNWKWVASIGFRWWLGWIICKKIFEILRRLWYVAYGKNYIVESLIVIVPLDSFHRKKVLQPGKGANARGQSIPNPLGLIEEKYWGELWHSWFSKLLQQGTMERFHVSGRTATIMALSPMGIRPISLYQQTKHRLTFSVSSKSLFRTNPSPLNINMCNLTRTILRSGEIVH